jgi:hypothetical protein
LVLQLWAWLALVAFVLWPSVRGFRRRRPDPVVVDAEAEADDGFRPGLVGVAPLAGSAR